MLKNLYLKRPLDSEVDWTNYEPVGKTHEHETPSYALRLIQAYIRKYQDEQFEAPLAVEEDFGFELAGECGDCRGLGKRYWTAIEPSMREKFGTLDHPCQTCKGSGVRKHLLLGRWDLVVKLPIGGSNGTIYHMQHKTTSAYTSLASYVRSYDLAWHERLYVAALKRRYPNEQVGGTILNVLRKAKKLSPENDLVRYFVPVSDSLIERFEAEAIEMIEDIEARERGEKLWRQNEKSCMAFNRLCSFHDLCLEQPIEIEQAFKKREADYVDLERLALGVAEKLVDKNRLVE